MVHCIPIPFTFVIMEADPMSDGWLQVASFENDIDVSGFIQMFEGSEGYVPKVFEYDSEEEVYHEWENVKERF